MTDEIDSDDVDSGRSQHEKVNATVKATSGPDDDPDVFLVEYADGDVAYEPGTPRNQALFGEGLYAEVDGVHAYDYQGAPVELSADVGNDDYVITVGDDDLPVPSDRIDDVIDAVDSAFTGEKLYDLYTDILDGQVRRSIVERFDSRFPEDRIEQTPEGWVVDDTFVVTYEADNHLVDLDPTDPYGGDVDESKQAVYLDIDADGERDVRAPDGDKVTLSEVEQEFLTTVEGLLYPDDYFGVELVDEIEQHKAQENALGDVFEDLATDAEVTGFTDSKSGIFHGSDNHGYDKHRLTDLGVTEEVADLLWAHDYDHAGVVELHMRKDELIERPDVNIFENTSDDDPDKWDKIERTKENAPIPPDVQNTLDSMYE